MRTQLFNFDKTFLKIYWLSHKKQSIEKEYIECLVSFGYWRPLKGIPWAWGSGNLIFSKNDISVCSSSWVISHISLASDLTKIFKSEAKLISWQHQLLYNYSLDDVGRCRWSSNPDEPLLYVKHDGNLLNILDTEKKALILKSPVEIESMCKHIRVLFLFFLFFHFGKRGLTL